MKINIYIFITILFYWSCSHEPTLNLQPHQFGRKAPKIVWIQVAGLSEEHVALLRFSKPLADQRTSFENFQCLGKAWAFNLYDIRPQADLSFLSQVTGSKNIKGTCSDFSKKPAWVYLQENGYEVGIIESGVEGKSSWSNSKACGENDFIGDATLWRLAKGEGDEFHYQGREDFEKGKTYFDRSCQQGVCYTSLYNNVKSIWNRFKKDRNKLVFVIRDSLYQKKVTRKKIGEAKEMLADIDKVIEFFQKESLAEEVFLMLSGAQTQLIELPKQGGKWEDFDKSGKYALFRNTSLMSPVWAMGVGAENFCGIYEESEMLKRLLWVPEGTLSPFSKIINEI